MRILGFSKKWPKLSNLEFTTFRFPRRDRDWAVGECAQIVYKPRSKEQELLGIAEIIDKCEKYITCYGLSKGVTNEEAKADGFNDRDDMLRWIEKIHGGIPYLMNKLTLRWLERK